MLQAESQEVTQESRAEGETARRRYAELLKRRRLFFGSLVGYIPMIWVVKQVAPGRMLAAFGVWVAFMFCIMMYSALAICPRCGNYFHMHGMTLLYLRRCLHCQFHVSRDRPSL